MAAEQYRSIAVQIGERMPDVAGSGYVLTVTSADAGSGKTLTSLNLALTLARGQERRILLVESDLWRPQLKQYINVPADQPGLFQLLGKQTDLKSAVVSLSISPGVTLDVITAGGAGQIGDLLSGPRMPELVARMAAQYEIVILDAPPLVLASGRSIARCADSSLLVVSARKTKQREVEEALQILGSERTLGLVLNRVRARNVSHTAYLAYTAYYDTDVESESSDAIASALDNVEIDTEDAPVAARSGSFPWRRVGWASAAVALVAAARFAPVGSGAAPQISSSTTTEPTAARDDSTVASSVAAEAAVEPTANAEAFESASENGASMGAEPTLDYYTTGRLNLRTGPALTYPVLKTLPSGQPIELLGEQGTWRAIRADGTKGWVISDWISRTEPNGRTNGQTNGQANGQTSGQANTGPNNQQNNELNGAPNSGPVEEPPGAFDAMAIVGLNVRAAPSLTGEILFAIPPQTSIRVLESQRNWHRIENSGRTAWVFAGGVSAPGHNTLTDGNPGPLEIAE